MWNYMKYLIYLDSKHKSQFDGGELYVQERFQGGFSDWIPSNRSLYLGKSRPLLWLTCENKPTRSPRSSASSTSSRTSSSMDSRAWRMR